MRSVQPQSRQRKIRLLSDLQQDKRTLQEIRPWKVEFWFQHYYYPDSFINEGTGEVITAAQMQEKKEIKAMKSYLLPF